MSIKVGIPKGLLYYKYYPFLHYFFRELGGEIITSCDTNKEILDLGVKYSVDEACLPVKIFHGHTAYVKDKCDILVIPRIMQLEKKEFICPKFCGITEMVVNSIPSLPRVTSVPIYAVPRRRLYSWALETGLNITKDKKAIVMALNTAIEKQKNFNIGFEGWNYPRKVALIGHPYNIYDEFTNMNVVGKLRNLEIGVVTEEDVEDENINREVERLYKRPFWTFARKSYGTGAYLAEKRLVDGIIYVSSFGCGIDSVIVELLRERIGDFPLLVLKIDEHTGEAGVDTRIEAFADMLERR